MYPIKTSKHQNIDFYTSLYEVCSSVYTFLLFEVWHDERGILKPHMSRTDLSESNWLCVDIRYRRRLFIIRCFVYDYTAVAGLIANRPHTSS